MQIQEVIQRVQSLYSKGVDSDDSRLSSRHIYNKLLTVRARLFVDDMRKGRSFSEWDQQAVHCIPMQFSHSMACNNRRNTCPVMKSTGTIPQAITMGEDENVMITSHDGGTIISRTTFESRKYLSGNKYTANRQFYYIHDNYLVLLNSRLKQAYMHGIFRDPIEAYIAHQTNMGNDVCMDYTQIDFYTPLNIIEKMVEMANLELVKEFNQSLEDLRNDSKDNLVEASK